MKYQIRNVAPEDLAAVSHVEAVCFPPLEAGEKETFRQRIETFPDSFLVAEEDGAIIGFINGCMTDERTLRDVMFKDSSLHNPKGAYQSIFGLDVMPDYRCCGVAAALMEALIQKSRERGKIGLILTCKERLVPYYEKFGYVNYGVSASTHGGAVWYDMRLEF